jgi:DNA invertase Pin-like site-specific DNA recombinase
MLVRSKGCTVLYKRQTAGIQMMSQNEKKAALYARVSTKNQDLRNQIKKLHSWAEDQEEFEADITKKEEIDLEDEEQTWEDCWEGEDLFSEQASSVKDRPKLEEIMDNLDEYDIIVVTKLDRFARSVIDFHKRIEVLKDHDVDFKTIDGEVQNFDTTSPQSNLMINILIAFAEFERKMINQRMDEGFRKAQEEGRVGRDPKLNKEGREWAAKKYEEGKSITTVQALVNQKYNKDLGWSTIRRYLDKQGVLE